MFVCLFFENNSFIFALQAVAVLGLVVDFYKLTNAFFSLIFVLFCFVLFFVFVFKNATIIGREAKRILNRRRKGLQITRDLSKNFPPQFLYVSQFD